MKFILSRRPSPAFVIACIALFVALGGVSYGVATGSIDSREVKNNTLRSKDVRNNNLRTFDIRNNEVRGFDIRNSTIRSRDVALNTLTGADISEADLAQVPSAAQADTATTATTAKAVEGLSVRKFFAKPPNGSVPVEVFRGVGFVVEAGCSAAGNPILRLDGIVGASPTNVTVAGSNDSAATPVTFASGPIGAGSDLNLLGAGVEGGGTATVTTTHGAVSTITYGAESSPAFGENACAVSGTVTSA